MHPLTRPRPAVLPRDGRRPLGPWHPRGSPARPRPGGARTAGRLPPRPPRTGSSSAAAERSSFASLAAGRGNPGAGDLRAGRGQFRRGRRECGLSDQPDGAAGAVRGDGAGEEFGDEQLPAWAVFAGGVEWPVFGRGEWRVCRGD